MTHVWRERLSLHSSSPIMFHPVGAFRASGCLRFFFFLIYDTHSPDHPHTVQIKWAENRETIQSHFPLCTRAFARIPFKLFSSDQHSCSPLGHVGGKFEKNIQNLLLVICMPRGARLLSIAPFFKPFDILLDVGVRLRCSSDTYCSLFQREREREDGVSVLIDRVGLCCTQTPNKLSAEFPQVFNTSN